MSALPAQTRYVRANVLIVARTEMPIQAFLGMPYAHRVRGQHARRHQDEAFACDLADDDARSGVTNSWRRRRPTSYSLTIGKFLVR
jgi:hypothetical protein